MQNRMVSSAVLFLAVLLQGQAPKRILVRQESEKFFEVNGVKETTLVYSERYSDGSGSVSDFYFTTITISPTTITLSGYGLGYGRTVKVTEAELAKKLEDIFKTRSEKVLVVVAKPAVSAQRLLSVLAICQPEVRGFLLPKKQ